jgi:hypothetical protein
MLNTLRTDRNLEAALLKLLERYTLEDIVASLHGYADMQARLAKVLEQTEAAAKWQHQAEALQIASEAFEEVDEDDDTYYFIY